MTHLEQSLFRALTTEWQSTTDLRNTISSAQYRPPLSDVAATLRQLRRASSGATWVRDRIERTALGTNGHAWRRVRRGTDAPAAPL